MLIVFVTSCWRCSNDSNVGNLIKRCHGPEQIFPQIKEVHLPNGYSQGAYDLNPLSRSQSTL